MINATTCSHDEMVRINGVLQMFFFFVIDRQVMKHAATANCFAWWGCTHQTQFFSVHLFKIFLAFRYFGANFTCSSGKADLNQFCKTGSPRFIKVYIPPGGLIALQIPISSVLNLALPSSFSFLAFSTRSAGSIFSSDGRSVSGSSTDMARGTEKANQTTSQADPAMKILR